MALEAETVVKTGIYKGSGPWSWRGEKMPKPGDIITLEWPQHALVGRAVWKQAIW